MEMNDVEIENEVFATLNKSGISFPPHLVFLLKALGFNSFRCVAKIDAKMINTIESTIRSLYGEPNSFETMDETEKLAKFGPFFFRNPSSLKFLPGEVAPLKCAVEVCSKIMLENFLSYRYIYQQLWCNILQYFLYRFEVTQHQQSCHWKCNFSDT